MTTLPCFAALAVPHPVSFVINATERWRHKRHAECHQRWNIISSELYYDDTLSLRRSILVSSPGEITSLPGNAVINATLFTLNDHTHSGYRTVSVADRLDAGLGACAGSARRDSRHNAIPDQVLARSTTTTIRCTHVRAARLFLR